MAEKEKGKKKTSVSRKNKYVKYLNEASCFLCKLVFRSKKAKKRHVDSNHECMLGVNHKRAY
jgi:hypothetical protein